MPNTIVASDITQVEAVDEAGACGRRADACGSRSTVRSPCLRPCARRAISIRDSASTMNVSTNSTRPSAISDARCTRIGRLVELVGERRGDRVAGLEQRRADLVRVADDERHRHRLAERAAEAQHDAADDADLRVRQHDVPDDFPGRAADAVGGLLQHRRHDLEHVAHHRRDERDHHHRQDDAGGQDADAVGRALEQRAEQRDVAEASSSAAAGRSRRTAARRRTGPTCRR